MTPATPSRLMAPAPAAVRWRGYASDFGLVLLAVFLAAALGVVEITWRERALPPFDGIGDRTRHPAVALDELRALVQARRAVVLDARDHDAYQLGHLPGALNLPAVRFDTAYPAIRSRIGSTPADHLLVVYCSDQWCGLAEELQQQLVDRGHARVAHFAGGLAAWSAAGLPVETGR